MFLFFLTLSNVLNNMDYTAAYLLPIPSSEQYFCKNFFALKKTIISKVM